MKITKQAHSIHQPCDRCDRDAVARLHTHNGYHSLCFDHLEKEVASHVHVYFLDVPTDAPSGWVAKKYRVGRDRLGNRRLDIDRISIGSENMSKDEIVEIASNKFNVPTENIKCQKDNPHVVAQT